MVQLEVETFPIIVGFTCGATIFILQWLFPAPGSARSAAARAAARKQAELEKDPEGVDEQPSPTASEPQSEPGPEPTPVAAPSRAWPALALLALFGLLAAVRAFSALQSGGLYAAPAPTDLLPPADVLPWSLAPEPAVPPEVAAQADVLNSEADLPSEEVAPPEEVAALSEASTSEVEPKVAEVAPPEVAALPESLNSEVEVQAAEAPAVEGEQEEVAEEEEQSDAEAAAAPEAEEEEGEAFVEAEELADVKPITLNLTRQTMSVQNVGDIIHYKSAYWGTVAIGTPAVDYKVVFDTGSGYLILPSTYCHSETCRAHKRYRRPASVTARDIDFDGTQVNPGEPRDEMTISFGTGEVTGVLVDDITCADDRGVSPDLELSGCMPLSMIIATEMTEEPFRTFHFDGVMGLGLLGLSKSASFSFIHNIGKHLQEQGGRTPNIFSVFLGEHRREASDITFGGYVADHLEDTISWNSVLHPELGHWMLEVKSVRIDDETISFCNSGCRAIVDTGTSLLAVPTPAFPEIHELLRHEADPVMDCKGPGPKLHIELEGLTLTLEPQDYARSESSLFGNPPKSRIRYPMFRNSTDDFEPEYCKPTLMSMELPEPVGPKLFVLGEPVLRKYYTVFDFTETAPRIGFGRATHRQALVLSEHELWEEEENGWR